MNRRELKRRKKKPKSRCLKNAFFSPGLGDRGKNHTRNPENVGRENIPKAQKTSTNLMWLIIEGGGGDINTHNTKKKKNVGSANEVVKKT